MALLKPQIICHVEKSLNYTLFDCKWVPGTAKFVVVGSMPNGTGVIEMFEICATDVKSVRRVETDVSLKTCHFGASPVNRKYLAVGDFNGNLSAYDLDADKSNIYSVASAHSEIINCIDGAGGKGGRQGPPEVASASRDGSVKIWDLRQQEKPVALIQPEEEEQRRDCWTVAFGNIHSPTDRMIATGYDNGDVKLFDLKDMSVVWEKNVRNGVCSLQFDRKDIMINKLLVTTLESKFHVFDCRTLHPEKGFSGLTEKAHKSTIWIGKHLPQNRDVFTTTGGAGSMCLWKYTYPDCRVKKDSEGVEMGVTGNVDLLQSMTLGSQPLSSFDWSPDKCGLAICTGFDQMLRVLIVTKLELV